MYRDGHIKTAQSTRILHIIIAFNSYYDIIIHTRIGAYMHMSTSNEYFYCSHVAVRFGFFIPFEACCMLFLVHRFVFFPLLSSKWDNKFMQRLALAHSPVQYHNLNSNTRISFDVWVCVCACVRAFAILCKKYEITAALESGLRITISNREKDFTILFQFF